MREPTVAKNYAEALFEIGERTGQTERFADLIEAVAGAIQADDRIRVVLESPRVRKDQKLSLIDRALGPVSPPAFVKFLHATIRRGRQGVLPAIATQYLALVDIKFNRVHAGITVARDPDRELQAEVKRRLTAILGKDVLPHYRTDPKILGGMIVRVGDRVMDGSLRRRLLRLRGSMLGR